MDDLQNHIEVEVKSIHIYSNFEELYKHHDKKSLGYKVSDVAHYSDMQQYYSVDEQKKYGVVAIEIKVV